MRKREIFYYLSDTYIACEIDGNMYPIQKGHYTHQMREANVALFPKTTKEKGRCYLDRVMTTNDFAKLQFQPFFDVPSAAVNVFYQLDRRRYVSAWKPELFYYMLDQEVGYVEAVEDRDTVTIYFGFIP